MESKQNLIEPLLLQMEENCKTGIELIKLRSVDKAADFSSTFISRLFLYIAFLFFLIIVSIGAALFLGELLGKNYYGFFVVASFYCVIVIIIYFLHPSIKLRLNNFIISKLLN